MWAFSPTSLASSRFKVSRAELPSCSCAHDNRRDPLGPGHATLMRAPRGALGLNKNAWPFQLGGKRSQNPPPQTALQPPAFPTPASPLPPPQSCGFCPSPTKPNPKPRSLAVSCCFPSGSGSPNAPNPPPPQRPSA